MMRTNVVVAMRNTALTRIKNKSHQVTLDNTLDVARTTSHNLDAMRTEFVQSTIAHATCQHYAHPHLLQIRRYARLTSATLGRRKRLSTHNRFILNRKD